MTIRYKVHCAKESLLEWYWCRRWKKAYKASMEFYMKYHEQDDFDEVNSKQFTEDWYELFKTVCWSFGFHKRDTKILFEGLVNGNWKRLHATEFEELQTAEYWIEELSNDVYYCSDRWSIDRLSRNHWRYRMAVRKLKEYEENDW